MKRRTSKHAEKKLHILITAGPTREYIDPVRYISNDSSGRMGFALARAAVHLGCATTLIAGPVGLDTPEGVRRIDIVSAKEMRDAALKYAKGADVIVMAAAVADFTPKAVSKGKIKKTSRNMSGIGLPLKRNADILRELCKRRRRNQTIVGFALETSNLEKNARAKLREKGCDYMVANSTQSIGSDIGRCIILKMDGSRISLPTLPKDDLAIIILSYIL